MTWFSVTSVLIVLTFIEGILGYLSIIDDLKVSDRDDEVLWMLEVLLQCSNISSSFSFTVRSLPCAVFSVSCSAGTLDVVSFPGSCGKSVIFPHLVGFHSSRQNIY